MLNSGGGGGGGEFHALRDKKIKYSNSRVVRKKNSERKRKNITPRLQVKWLVPYQFN